VDAIPSLIGPRNRFLAALIAAAGILLLGCEGSPGDTGAPGPRGVAGPPGDPGDDGDPGLRWRGDWSASSTYEVDDAVHSAGSAYVCRARNTNQPPPAPSFWNLLAAQGDPGADGTWNGGEVTGSAAFHADVGFHGPLRVLTDQAMLFRDGSVNRTTIHRSGIDLRNAGGEKTVEIDGQTRGELRLNHPNGGERIYLWVDYTGGDDCGIVRVYEGSTVTAELSGCNGGLRLFNSLGQLTIELDGETGDLYLSGEVRSR